MITQGYNKTSIVFHWAAAVFIIALYLTGESARGSFAFTFHIGFGATAGIFLIWRAVRRMIRGMPEKSDQSELLNLLSKSVIWGFLIAMIALTITGYLIIWYLGRPIDVFGWFALPSPLTSNHDLHETAEEVHELLAHFLLVLFLLHIAGTIKHKFIDKDSITDRIITAVKGGK